MDCINIFVLDIWSKQLTKLLRYKTLLTCQIPPKPNTRISTCHLKPNLHCQTA